MKDWQIIADLACRKRSVAGATFQSWGDWDCQIHQIRKQKLDAQTAFAQISKKFFRNIGEENMQRKIIFNIEKFEEALSDNNVESQNIEEFKNKFNITKLIYYERLYQDGNSRFAVAEDAQHYYCIGYWTS